MAHDQGQDHGKVKTNAEKEKATLAVRSDEAIKPGVATALKSDKPAEGVTVASVTRD